MSFTSPVFLVFLVVVASVYYLIPGKLQNIFLLLSSLVFYMWAVPEFGLLIVFTAVLSYFAAIWIERLETNKSKCLFIISIVVIAGLLILFKYVDFVSDITVYMLALVGLKAEIGHLGLIVPVGISFYTFETIGYLADVKMGKKEAERNFIDYLLFVTFFPAVMSGPIARAGELIPQFKTRRKYCYDNVRIGLQRFLTGAFRKIVIADGIGIIVSKLYENVDSQAGSALVAAFMLYGIQIYFDFSGYSDMAIGVAKVLDIRLRENFNVPYSASDFNDFWARWHMSLTLWLRDYIYIPLGGNRRGKTRKLINIAIVFIISGIWHGAEMGYVVWGAIHAVLRVIEELAPSLKYRDGDGTLKRAIGIVKVFILSSFAFMFFNIGCDRSIIALGRMFTDFNIESFIPTVMKAASLGIAEIPLWYMFVFVSLGGGLLLMIFLDAMIVRTGNKNPLELLSSVPRWAACFFMEAEIIMFYLITSGSGMVNFIYFGY